MKEDICQSTQEILMKGTIARLNQNIKDSYISKVCNKTTTHNPTKMFKYINNKAHSAIMSLTLMLQILIKFSSKATKNICWKILFKI